MLAVFGLEPGEFLNSPGSSLASIAFLALQRSFIRGLTSVAVAGVFNCWSSRSGECA
ncbi:hypothetical protein ACFYY3_10175 [Streptomyces sp. NPDC001812]|uniref:Uncharacterized protein n=1 Tax=Streptomyces cathayae TaxID=3031124 RepID=A0ABY8JY89_9ACTN|nr:hypothetical protein [Streptomyces sp. HUAS 5]WGD40741.1 hypothetical protein PYS65_11605 [Streptomyces sp. HUAS 5]